MAGNEQARRHFVLFYDYVEGILEKRAPFRAPHLALCKEFVARGDLLLGGPLQDPTDAAILVFHVLSASEVDQFVAQDPYVLNGLVVKWAVRPWMVLVGCAPTVPTDP
eukprot:SM000076S21768  [mRNA]  locus=s76:153871:154876:- [translate_table: standard]